MAFNSRGVRLAPRHNVRFHPLPDHMAIICITTGKLALCDINAIIRNENQFGRALVANLIVRNVDDDIAEALKARARRHGVSAEAEHRRILAEALTHPKKRSFLEVLSQMPDVGTDEDFARRQDRHAAEPFED